MRSLIAYILAAMLVALGMATVMALTSLATLGGVDIGSIIGYHLLCSFGIAIPVMMMDFDEEQAKVPVLTK